MSRYHRENPDEPIRHDWLTGGKRLPETASNGEEPSMQRVGSWRICKPVWVADAGSWRVGLHFVTIHTAWSRCYAVGIYVPLLTCVLMIEAKPANVRISDGANVNKP